VEVGDRLRDQRRFQPDCWAGSGTGKRKISVVDGWELSDYIMPADGLRAGSGLLALRYGC